MSEALAVQVLRELNMSASALAKATDYAADLSVAMAEGDVSEFMFIAAGGVEGLDNIRWLMEHSLAEARHHRARAAIFADQLQKGRQ